MIEDPCSKLQGMRSLLRFNAPGKHLASGALRNASMRPMVFETQTIVKIQDVRKELAERFSVRSIGVFGSTATGHAHKQSDVDILVELNEPTFDNYMELKFRLEEVLGRDVDLVLKDALKPRLKPIIEKEVRYV